MRPVGRAPAFGQPDADAVRNSHSDFRPSPCPLRSGMRFACRPNAWNLRWTRGPGSGITHSEHFERLRREGGPLDGVQAWVANRSGRVALYRLEVRLLVKGAHRPGALDAGPCLFGAGNPSNAWGRMAAFLKGVAAPSARPRRSGPAVQTRWISFESFRVTEINHHAKTSARPQRP